MVEIKPAALWITIFGIVCSIIVFCLDIRLVIKLFRNDGFRRKHDYQKFFYRFCFDLIMAVTVTVYFTGMCVFFINSEIINYQPLFYWALITSNLNAARGILALFIAIERFWAVYFPITFRNYGEKVPVLVVILIPISFGMFEDVMLYHFCQFSYVEKAECSAFGCALNSCFLKYWGVNKTIIAGTTAILSLLLFIKLIYLRVKSSSTSNNLTRANQLCLVDTVTVIIFDLSPYFFTLLLGDQVIHLDGYGPYNAVVKAVACVVDSIIASIVINKAMATTKHGAPHTIASTTTRVKHPS